jgi:hypothetical protein
MAQYLVLIYANEESWANADEGLYGRMYAEHESFGTKHHASLRGGNALEPSMTATSIRKSASGEAVTTDGPFAETKEAIGGYYVIEADDLDAALAIAKDVPAQFGGVEVRPIRDMS